MSHVTVVLPVYNSERTLDTAVASILGQTFSELDVVIINDGSTDGTLRLMQELAARESRVSLISNVTNRGIAAAFNCGWRVAKGDFIAIQHADDISLPTRLAEQVAYLTSHPQIDVLGTGAYLVTGDGTPLGECYRPENHEDIISNIYRRNVLLNPSIVMRRRFLDNTNGCDESLGSFAEDTDLWLRGYKAHRYHNLQRLLIQYCVKRRLPFQAALNGSLVLFSNAARHNELVNNCFFCAKPVIAHCLRQVGLLPRFCTAEAWRATPAQNSLPKNG
jgi:glycosyltransferase involved in cell wall biosynthesis